jgi:hypothetical protein
MDSVRSWASSCWRPRRGGGIAAQEDHRPTGGTDRRKQHELATVYEHFSTLMLEHGRTDAAADIAKCAAETRTQWKDKHALILYILTRSRH